MNTSDEVFELRGSITKNESLSPVTYRILENTFVSEAGDPYADYYGDTPRILKPNSLFLFTKKFYSLDEILKVTCDMYDFFGYTRKIDIATAILDFADHYHYAIRVRDFPDFDHIHWLQTCYKREGIDFLGKVSLQESASVTVFKCFVLTSPVKGIYLDKSNGHKGYISIPHQINKNDFREMLDRFKNSQDCELFDAAVGTFDRVDQTENIVRIYSENMNMHLLECAKHKFMQYILRNELNPC